MVHYMMQRFNDNFNVKAAAERRSLNLTGKASLLEYLSTGSISQESAHSIY